MLRCEVCLIVLLQSVTTTAVSQISTYLNQCKEFADTTATNLEQSMHNKLQTLCRAADTVCADLGRDAEMCSAQTKELAALYQTVEQEVSALTAEATALCAQCTKEDREAREQIHRLRVAAVDGVRKALTARREEKEAGKSDHKQKLLKALREL